MAKVLTIPKEILTHIKYNPDTGDLTWVTHRNSNAKEGSLIKASIGRPFRLSFNNKRYLAHRVIWFIMTGQQPSEVIDHIDRNPLNNKWNNLRLVSKSENYINSTRFDNAKGIYYDKRDGSYQVYLTKGSKRVIKRVKTLEEAQNLRKELLNNI